MSFASPFGVAGAKTGAPSFHQIEMWLDHLVRLAKPELGSGRTLADAHTNPPESDLSSLRKGAEVAVKPVVWEKYWGGSNDDIPSWRASTPVGLTLDVDFAGERLEKHSDADPVRLAAKQAEAFAWYETRIRSALVSGSREEG